MRASPPVLATLVVITLASVLAGCSRPSEPRLDNPRESSGSTQARPDQPSIVVFEPASKPRAAVLVEVVREPEDLQRGLMHRRELEENRGMLFLMGEERVQSFWMRNTYIALDMIFVDHDLRVVGVVANATPLTDESRSVGKPSLYVVEVNAGWAASHGVTAGTPVRFQNVAL